MKQGETSRQSKGQRQLDVGEPEPEGLGRGGRQASRPRIALVRIYLVAAGITGSDLELEDCPVETLETVIDKLRDMGMRFEDNSSSFRAFVAKASSISISNSV